MYKYYCFIFSLWYILLISFFVDESSANYHYYISSDNGTFFQAFINCQEGGADLASITDQNEANALNKTLQSLLDPEKKYAFWLSGTNLANKSSSDYYWFTGGQEANYTLWLPGEPNNQFNIEHCLTWVQQNDGTVGWNDLDCETSLPYICQQYYVN